MQQNIVRVKLRFISRKVFFFIIDFRNNDKMFFFPLLFFFLMHQLPRSLTPGVYLWPLIFNHQPRGTTVPGPMTSHWATANPLPPIQVNGVMGDN